MWVGVAGKRSHIVYIIKISKFMYNHEQKSLGHLICNVKKNCILQLRPLQVLIFINAYVVGGEFRQGKLYLRMIHVQ